MLSIFLLLSLFGVANASSSHCIATDSSTDSYVCTETSKYNPPVDSGVPQRISGSAGETTLDYVGLSLLWCSDL